MLSTFFILIREGKIISELFINDQIRDKEVRVIGENGEQLGMDLASYLKVAKLTAILKLSNGLDRSHKQKFKTIKAMLHEQEQELVLSVDTAADITLEKGLIKPKAQFFEEVYSIRPVIRQKRNYGKQ